MRQGRKGPVIHKALSTTFDDFYKVYRKFYEPFECAIHFRYATQGKRDLANCHPYDLDGGVYMMHNGCITGLPTTNPDMSDTWHFGEWLRPYAKEALLAAPDRFKEVLKRAIGANNKLILMHNGKFTIVNDTQGTYDESNGVWYSNCSMWAAPLELGGTSAYGYYDMTGFHSWVDDGIPNYEKYAPKVTVLYPTQKTLALPAAEPATYEEYQRKEEMAMALEKAQIEESEYTDWWRDAIDKIEERLNIGEITDEEAVTMIEAANGDYLQSMEESPGHYQVCEPAPECPTTWAEWLKLSKSEMALASHLFTDEMARSFATLLRITVGEGSMSI